jgi:hypothetical protein
LHFIRDWAQPDAKVVTPGKRTVDLVQQQADKPGYVFFVLNRESQAVMIGYAQDVQKRLDALQTRSPNRLELMGVIQAKSIDAPRL